MSMKRIFRRLKFSIRDLLWLALFVALPLGEWAYLTNVNQRPVMAFAKAQRQAMERRQAFMATMQSQMVEHKRQLHETLKIREEALQRLQAALRKPKIGVRSPVPTKEQK